MGLDEDTAVFMGPDDVLHVEGSGGVTIVDASDVSFSSVHSVSEGQPVAILGLKVNVLITGTTFDLNTRTASAAGLFRPKE
jgi:cyanophycinase